MAIDLSSESPRISFSHDLPHTDVDVVPIENYPHSSLLYPNPDFHFCINNTTENQTSSADELFSGGQIRPLQPQQKLINPQPLKTSKETTILKSTLDSDQPKNQPKSFWKFKRSSSLHCENTWKKSSFWSLPLLSRSSSAGSVPSSKQESTDNQKKNSQKQRMPSSSGFYVYSSSQKSPYKKNYGGFYGGNGVRINPVLNVSPPFISKGTANLLGLGSFFGNGKDKRNKK